jgi:hypothetical protein
MCDLGFRSTSASWTLANNVAAIALTCMPGCTGHSTSDLLPYVFMPGKTDPVQANSGAGLHRPPHPSVQAELAEEICQGKLRDVATSCSSCSRVGPCHVSWTAAVHEKACYNTLEALALRSLLCKHEHRHMFVAHTHTLWHTHTYRAVGALSLVKVTFMVGYSSCGLWNLQLSACERVGANSRTHQMVGELLLLLLLLPSCASQSDDTAAAHRSY